MDDQVCTANKFQNIYCSNNTDKHPSDLNRNRMQMCYTISAQRELFRGFVSTAVIAAVKQQCLLFSNTWFSVIVDTHFPVHTHDSSSVQVNETR